MSSQDGATSQQAALGRRPSREASETTERQRLEHQAGVVEKMLGTRLRAPEQAVDALRGDVPGLLARADGTARKLGRPIEPEDLEQIMAAAERAADLTRQLLARAIGEDVRVVADLEPHPWPIRCDLGLFGQVVLNLAVNARDAMPAGGTLTLTTQNSVIAPGDAVPDPAMTPGDDVRLLVEDTGAGMPPEVAERVFEPFFTTKGPGQGTGLGVSTVCGIMKQSGAHISVRSPPGLSGSGPAQLPAGSSRPQ